MALCNISKLFRLHNIKCNKDDMDDIINGNSYIKRKYISDKSNIVQYGSGEAYYNYKMKIKFYYTEDNYGTMFSLHNENIEENHECIAITVSKELDGDAELNSISNEGKCMSDKGLFQLNGTQMLTIAIEFIKDIKNKYNIKRIVLGDRSRKLCGTVNLSMPILHTLMHGNTWYGKYGFRPMSRENDVVNIMDTYSKNKQIYRRAKVKDINNLKRYIYEYFKSKKEVDREEHKNIIYIYDMHNLETVLVSCFIKYLLDFGHCEFIAYIYEKIFNDLGYIDTTKDRLFYLDI